MRVDLCVETAVMFEELTNRGHTRGTSGSGDQHISIVLRSYITHLIDVPT